MWLDLRKKEKKTHKFYIPPYIFPIYIILCGFKNDIYTFCAKKKNNKCDDDQQALFSQQQNLIKS